MEHDRKQGQRAGQRGEAINNRAREQDRGRETQVRQQIIGDRKEREQHRGSQRTERDGRKRKIRQGRRTEEQREKSTGKRTETEKTKKDWRQNKGKD